MKPGPVARPVMERLWEKVDIRSPSECWPWKGTRVPPYGYGQIDHVPSAKLVLEEKLGRPLMPGEETRHSCDNPPCCNPAHLSPGSSQDNADDMVARGRQQKHERHWNAKLTIVEVEAIRASSEPSTWVAPLYGVSPRTVRKIRQGTRW